MSLLRCDDLHQPEWHVTKDYRLVIDIEHCKRSGPQRTRLSDVENVSGVCKYSDCYKISVAASKAVLKQSTRSVTSVIKTVMLQCDDEIRGNELAIIFLHLLSVQETV